MLLKNESDEIRAYIQQIQAINSLYREDLENYDKLLLSINKLLKEDFDDIKEFKRKIYEEIEKSGYSYKIRK